MKAFLPFLIAVGLMPNLHAQEKTAPKPTPHPLPAGTLFQRRAPEFAQWAITYDPPLDKKGAPPGGQSSAPAKGEDQKFTRRVLVTKTKNILQEQTVDAKGQRSETWRIGNLQFTTIPGSSERIEIDPKSFARDSNEQYYSDFSKTDFSGFEWISPKDYVDINNVGGRDCIIFVNKAQTLTEDAARQLGQETAGESSANNQIAPGGAANSTVAYVDLATRLPVMLRCGKETRVYEYRAAPQAMLIVPADLQKDLENRAKQREQMARMPARPF